MAKFIINFIQFTVISIVVVAALLLIVNNPEKLGLLGEVFNDGIEAKIESLYLNVDGEKPTIIIAGDSRAERQISPSIIQAQTDTKIINIAVSAGDLSTLIKALKKYNIDKTTGLFIISAGSFQISDASIGPGYMSINVLNQLTLEEKYSLFGNHWKIALKMLKYQIRGTLKSYLQKIGLFKKKYPKSILDNYGFNGITGNFDPEELENSKAYWERNGEIKIPWYKATKTDGIRWENFKKNLFQLSEMRTIKFIFYQPPVSPAWYNLTKNTKIDQIENQFSLQLKNEILNYPNIMFWDFYNTKITVLKDSMYYDPMHLNKNGAELFTKHIMNLLINLGSPSNTRIFDN
ncbi:MAG: hypothetical protein HQ521_02590 [Bacteroidetes bacterium]|nr:hypothetical protein [Bacteroidota bacterium]